MENKFNNGELGIIFLDNFKKRGTEVCEHIMKARNMSDISQLIIPAKSPRFSNGEGKVILDESVRDKDIYIISNRIYTYVYISTITNAIS